MVRKKELNKRDIGSAGKGPFICWHNDPNGSKLIPIQKRPGKMLKHLKNYNRL